MLRISPLFFCLLLFSVSAYAAVEKTTNPASGLSKWKAVEQGFSLEIIQLSADYVRAVFLARGLPENVVEEISQYCLFGNIIKNNSNAEITAHVSDWRFVTGDGEKHKLKLKSEWVKEWSSKGVAFRWLMLAEQQSFDEGDWIQGFSSVALKPGSIFDLHYSWTTHGKTVNKIIKGVQCAPK